MGRININIVGKRRAAESDYNSFTSDHKCMIEIPDTFRGGEDAEIETQKVSRGKLSMGSGYPPPHPLRSCRTSRTLQEQAGHPAGTNNVL